MNEDWSVGLNVDPGALRLLTVETPAHAGEAAERLAGRQIREGLDRMLARIHRTMEQKDEGFTLIELLVVIIIIGVLAAIAIPVFLNKRDRAHDAVIKSDLRNAATAEEAYLTDNGVYTSTPADLISNGWRQSSSSNYQGRNTAFSVTGFYDVAFAYTSGAATATAAGGFCLTLTSASGTSWSYDSTKGGPQPAGVVCA